MSMEQGGGESGVRVGQGWQTLIFPISDSHGRAAVWWLLLLEDRSHGAAGWLLGPRTRRGWLSCPPEPVPPHPACPHPHPPLPTRRQQDGQDLPRVTHESGTELVHCSFVSHSGL